MSAVDPSLRRELALLCRRKRTRSHVFSPDRPTHWAPGEVINPRTGQPFTEMTAWEHIATLLEDGHEVEIITLEHPPGKMGYVMIERRKEGELYVKLQRGRDGILCRSFHLSTRNQRT